MERRWVGLGDKLARSGPGLDWEDKRGSEVCVENIQIDKYVVQQEKEGEVNPNKGV